MIEQKKEFKFERGDLLFTLVEAGGKKYFSHSIIYAPNEKFPLLPAIHAVNDEKAGKARLMATSVRAGVSYRVFRSKSAEFGIKAAEQAIKWASYDTPYSEKRKSIQSSVSSKADVKLKEKGKAPDEKHRLEIHKKNWRNRLSFHAMKNAARREGPLTLAEHESLGAGSGVRCSMFVVQVYQAVGLESVVKSVPFGEWTSDKYCDEAALKELSATTLTQPTRFSLREMASTRGRANSLSLYEEHCAAVKTTAEYPGITLLSEDKIYNPDHTRFPPTLQQVDLESYPDISKIPFEKLCTEAMTVDCKVIDIVDLVYALEHDKQNWIDCGEIPVEKQDFSPRTIEKYKEQLKQHAELQQKKRHLHTEQVIEKYVHGAKQELSDSTASTKEDQNSIEEEEYNSDFNPYL